MRKRPVAERFWEKVDVRGPDDCWPWQGYTMPFGHGMMTVEGRATLAHRVAYEIQVGPIPEGKKVLHSCDNPGCCNGHHLFVGTIADNNADMLAKGRGRWPGPKNPRRGEASPFAVLSEALVIEARARNAAGQSVASLAREYGVRERSLYAAVRGEKWKHLPFPSSSS